MPSTKKAAISGFITPMLLRTGQLGQSMAIFIFSPSERFGKACLSLQTSMRFKSYAEIHVLMWTRAT